MIGYEPVSIRRRWVAGSPGWLPADSKDGLGWVAVRMGLSAKYKYRGNEARPAQVIAAKAGIRRVHMDPRFRGGDDLDGGFPDSVTRQLVLVVCFHRHSRFVRKNSRSADLQADTISRADLKVSDRRQFGIVACFHRDSRFVRKNSRSADLQAGTFPRADLKVNDTRQFGLVACFHRQSRFVCLKTASSIPPALPKDCHSDPERSEGALRMKVGGEPRLASPRFCTLPLVVRVLSSSFSTS